MACTPTPTATLFGTSELVSSSVSTQTTTTVSTVPPTTVTSTTTSCADPSASASGSCSSEVTSIITSTIPGGTTTITNQFPVTISTTFTSTFPTGTLFSTCTSQPTQPPQASDSANGSSVFMSSSESTLPNGALTTTVLTYTSPVSSQTGASPGLNSGGANSTSPSNLGAIIGGALGGFFGLLLFAGAFLCWRRKRRWDDIYEKESVHGIDDDDHRPIRNLQPAPYHYGLVGHHTSPSVSSPPGSPASRPMTYHSRVESSGGVSVVSRESTVPLNTADTLMTPPIAQQAPSHPRRLSHGNEGLLLMRPLEPTVLTPSSPPDTSRRSLQSTGPSSPTTSGQSYFPLRVTNADDIEAGSSRGMPTGFSSHKRDKSSSQSPVVVHVDGGHVASGSQTKDVEDDAPPAYMK